MKQWNKEEMEEFKLNSAFAIAFYILLENCALWNFPCRRQTVWKTFSVRFNCIKTFQRINTFCVCIKMNINIYLYIFVFICKFSIKIRSHYILCNIDVYIYIFLFVNIIVKCVGCCWRMLLKDSTNNIVFNNLKDRNCSLAVVYWYTVYSYW